MNQVAKTKQALSKTRVRPMSVQVAEVRQNISVIHEALKSIMKADTHYGVIPGCGKPSLYKAGAEVIIALFKLSTDPVIDNLSEDGEIRYQVKVNVTTREGVFVGSGIGECSSGEEKYMWRAAICDKEFEVTQETMRRIKFKKKWKSTEVEEIQQVRVNPSDLANTILKMAKKRALIDAVLTATGASDIFTQDIQDLPEGYIESEEATETQPAPSPQPDSAPPEQEQQQRQGKIGEKPISPAQAGRFYAIAKTAGMEDDYIKEWLFSNFSYASSKDIDWRDYEEICNAAEAYKKV